MHAKPFADLPLWTDYLHAPHSLPSDATTKERFADERDAVDRLVDVVNPTLSFFPASGSGPRPAVLVCPGGGYSILAWNHEGTDIAAWLQGNGISAFLLKYRCPSRRDAALADAARAMRIIRSRAEEWGVDPTRIGTIGFSAGAHLSVRLSNLPSPEAAYEALDEIDGIDPRPDFNFVIYPAYLDAEKGSAEIVPELCVSERSPKAFVFQAEDDKDLVGSSIAYYRALMRNGVRAELHIVPDGGHGYGLFHRGKASDVWPKLAMDWFQREVMGKDVW